MGILQTLGIMTDDGSQPSKAGEPNAGSVAPMPQVTPAVAPAVSISAVPGVTDPSKASKYAENLAKAIDTANLPGIDFLEYYKGLGALESVMIGSDERMRFSAAFASLAASGATPDNIVKTADHYLDILDREQKGFAEHLQAKTETEVNVCLRKADDLQNQIREKSDAITRLTQEITSMTQESLTLRNTAAQAKNQLESDEATFISVKTALSTRISDVRQKFITYIMPGKA